MIPNNLPYRKLPWDEIETENLTWFDYIIGRFSGEMWWERDDIDASGIDSIDYHTIPFPEEPGILHLWFFGKMQETEYRTNIPWLKGGRQCAEELRFYPDTQCRFDIWTLYNHSTEVNLEIGGAVKIRTLPKQEDVENVPALTDIVPSDVPLIFGPRIYNPSEPSIPHRPFVQNNPQISNLTDMESRLREHLRKLDEKKKRQQRQYAQREKKKRQKEQHQRKKRQQRQKEQRSRRQTGHGRTVPKASSE